MGYKKKTEKTLMTYTKKELIEQIRTLEHNWECDKTILVGLLLLVCLLISNK